MDQSNEVNGVNGGGKKDTNFWPIVIWVLAGLVVAFVLVLWLRPDWILGMAQRTVLPAKPREELLSPSPSVTKAAVAALTPTLVNRPGEYACDPIGICNHYIKTEGMGCPKTYAEPTCSNECANNKSVWCTK